MENDEFYMIQLRDCFTGGYTLPQYCIDNGIKKPLFVSEEKFLQFMWEIHVQFSHDKRIKPDFVSLHDKEITIRLFPGTLFKELNIQNLSKLISSKSFNYDKIFVLSIQKGNLHSDKIIYLDELTIHFIRRIYMEIPALHFLQRNPKIKFFFTNFTVLNPDSNNTARENQILADKITLSKILDRLKEESTEILTTPYDELGYSRQDLIDMLSDTEAKINPDGSSTLVDDNNPLIRVKNGRRVVPNQPEHFQNHIYFMGGCSHFGTGAPFDKTIPAYLQQMLNENNLPYRVENVSQFFTYRYQDIFYNLNHLSLKPGDIIFIFFDNMLSNILPSFDVSNVFARPHNYGEIFADSCHVTELGYKILAEKFFKFLTENNFFRDKEFVYPPPVNHHIATVYLRNSRRAA